MNPLIQNLQDAKHTRTPIRPFTESLPSFSLEEAYKLQSTQLESDLAQGEQQVGYKMGLTSRAKQKDVGVEEPICGYLLKSMVRAQDGKLRIGALIHPRIEPEVSVILKEDVEGDIPLKDLLPKIEAILPAIEILDSRFENYHFKLPDVVADNASASGFILGKKDLKPFVIDLRLMGIFIRLNAEVVESGCPAAVLGNPLQSVLELLRLLQKRQGGLKKGMVVLTGGITASIPLHLNDAIEIVWPTETFELRVTP